MKFFYNPQVWQDGFFAYNFFVSFTLLLLVWGEIVLAFFMFRDAAFITLHYSIYFGVDWLGGVYNFLIFSGMATAVFVVNFLSAGVLHRDKKILSHFLCLGSSLVLLFIFIGATMVLYINWNSAIS